MPSASYYRDQARLLLSWALAARDPQVAARLEARARLLLAQAELPDCSVVRDLNPILDEFNQQQMAGPRQQRQQPQQQQQAQPKKDGDKGETADSGSD